LKAFGYKLAVCSNSVSETIELMMARAGLSSYLEFYLSNEDVTHAKPHPEMYQTAIERLGFSPTEVLIVEDNPNGLKAARASGAHVLQVESVNDVTLSVLLGRIKEVEQSVQSSYAVPANSNKVMRAA
jgi:beta-phosphoglucomutase-like phosphatase (HAD superfamily)